MKRQSRCVTAICQTSSLSPAAISSTPLGLYSCIGSWTSSSAREAAPASANLADRTSLIRLFAKRRCGGRLSNLSPDYLLLLLFGTKRHCSSLYPSFRFLPVANTIFWCLNNTACYRTRAIWKSVKAEKSL